jgi:ABC-type multidrug transport system fused ATPase/permease subunit
VGDQGKDQPFRIWVLMSNLQYRSGKSSLIMALFRAVDSSLMSGHVLLDGVDTQTMPLEKLRNAMRCVEYTIIYISVKAVLA